MFLSCLNPSLTSWMFLSCLNPSLSLSCYHFHWVLFFLGTCLGFGPGLPFGLGPGRPRLGFSTGLSSFSLEKSSSSFSSSMLEWPFTLRASAADFTADGRPPLDELHDLVEPSGLGVDRVN